MCISAKHKDVIYMVNIYVGGAYIRYCVPILHHISMPRLTRRKWRMPSTRKKLTPKNRARHSAA